METLFAKEIIAIFGPAGLLMVGIAFFLNKKIKKNCEKIDKQVEEDKKHTDILAKHDTAIQLLQNDVGYIKKQGETMDKKLDRLLEK